MTLVQAVSNDNDFNYYNNFCQDGATRSMVSLKSFKTPRMIHTDY